jgi:hypothetical protein
MHRRWRVREGEVAMSRHAPESVEVALGPHQTQMDERRRRGTLRVPLNAAELGLGEEMRATLRPRPNEVGQSSSLSKRGIENVC